MEERLYQRLIKEWQDNKAITELPRTRGDNSYLELYRESQTYEYLLQYGGSVSNKYLIAYKQNHI